MMQSNEKGAPDRKSRYTPARPDEVEIENKKTLAAAVSSSVPLAELRFLPKLPSLNSPRDN